MPATTQGNYLEISNFNWGSVSPPVLYDLTNNKRYTANTQTAGLLKFAVPASSFDRKLVLVSEDVQAVNNVVSITAKNFIDLRNTANQGDYLIISNSRLFAGSNLLPNMRSIEAVLQVAAMLPKSTISMSWLTSLDLASKPPTVCKNFLKYARQHFTVSPKFAFLIGKAVTYNEYRMQQNSSYDDKLNLVPTFGWLASDVLLASDDLSPVPATPIGRLAVISPEEISVYLDKIKLYEQQQQSTVQTIDNKAWMKTMVHVVGANDASLDFILSSHQNNYKRIIEDTLYGANVSSFNRTETGPETPVTNALMENLFHNGISLLNYFGHSAATGLDYNLNSPDQFDNYGKYPVLP